MWVNIPGFWTGSTEQHGMARHARILSRDERHKAHEPAPNAVDGAKCALDGAIRACTQESTRSLGGAVRSACSTTAGID